MKGISQRHNNGLIALIALMMVAVAVWRIPVLVNLMRVSFQYLFEMATLFCFAAFIYLYANRWVGAYFALATINMAFPFYTPSSMLAMAAVTIACLWYVLIVLTANKKQCNFLMDAMVVIALAHIIMQCLQALGVDPLFTDRMGTRNKIALGFMSNPNETAALLAFCLPAFFRPRLYLGVIAVIGGLILAKVTMGIIAVVAGLMFLMFCQFGYRWVFVGIPAGALGLVSYFIYVDMPGLERWEVWKTGFKIWAEPWIFGAGIDRWVSGMGLGHWKVYVNFPINEHLWKTAHNEYLQGLFEQGIGFPIIIGGYFFNIIRRTWRKTHEFVIPLMALVIIAVNCSANFCMHIAPTAMLAVTWMAILQVYLKDEQSSEAILR